MHRHHLAGTPVAALRRVIGGLITALAVTASVVLTGAATAQAEPSPVNDSFENRPETRWRFFTSGPAVGHFWEEDLYSHSGLGSVELVPSPCGAICNPTRPSGWVSVERSVTLDPLGGVRTCQGSVFVGNRSKEHQEQGLTGTVHLQVIDAATWTYISDTTKVIPYSWFYNWQQVNFEKVVRTASTMVFRIGIETPKAFLIVDDFSISCSNALH